MDNTGPRHSTPKEYGSGIFYSLLANLGSILGGLLTLALASRVLTRAELGTYYMILMVTHISVAVSGIGGRSAIVKYLAGSAERERTANLLILMRGAMILLVSAGLWVFLYLDCLGPATALGPVKWMILPMAALEIAHNAGVSMLAGFGLFKPFALVQGLRGVLTAGITIFLLFRGFGLEAMILGGPAATLITGMLIWHLLPIRFYPVWKPSDIWEILKFGGLVYGAYLLSVLTAKTAEAVIISLLGPAALAVWGNAMRFPNLMLRLFETVRPILLAFFSTDQDRATAEQTLRTALISITLASSLLILFAGPLTLVLFSRQYLSAIPLTRLLSFWAALSLVNYLMTIELTGRAMLLPLIWLNAVQFILVLGGHLMLVPLLGIIGAGISAATAAVLTLPVSAWFLSGRERSGTVRMLMTCLRPILPLFILLISVQAVEPSPLLSPILWLVFAGGLVCTKAIAPKEIKTALTRFGNPFRSLNKV